MSQFRIKQPVIHLPTFREYKISGAELARNYTRLDIEMPFARSDRWYYHSDAEGWAKILPDLVTKSPLYRKDKFDCEDRAIKAQTTCAERYGLNTLRYTYGDMPLGAHGFNSFWIGDCFMLFEPDESFADERGKIQDLWGYLDGDIVFQIGDNGYFPIQVLI